jgi:hypothetical protein
MLAENPALLNAKYEEWNETPLGAASHVGARPVAEYLLAAGAPLTICTAAMLGDRGAVTQFLAADPAQAQATGAHGIPVLTHAALSGDTAIADLLVQYGGGAGAGPGLVLAAMRGHRDMVAWLLAHGADIATPDWQGKTALQLATEHGHEETAALLRQHGASA